MEYVKLEEICTIVSGGTPSRSKPNYWNNGNIPWIKIKDMKSKYIDSAEEFITEEGLNNSSTKMLKRDTLLYSIFATLGEVGILKIDACTNQAIAGLSLKEDSNILKEYLYYYLKSKKKDVNNLGRGVAQNNINLSLLRKFKIPVIPLCQQKKIIEVLDNVSSTINNYERELALLDELVKARFVEMFGDPVLNEKGWITKPLIDMGNCKNGMNFHYNENGYEVKCLGVGDFKDLSIINNIESLQTVSLNEMPTEEYMLRDNDIVFVRSNGNKALVGRSIVIYPGDVPTTFSGFCIRYRKYDDSIIVPYLLHVLKTDSFRNKMIGRGANIQNLNQQILANLIIPVPPLELQNQFASFVEEIDKSRFMGENYVLISVILQPFHKLIQ